MSQYKPMLIHFDETSYNLELTRAKQKKDYFDKAIQWVERYDMNPEGEEVEQFHNSFSNYFRIKITEKHQNSIGLPLSSEKLLDLLEIKISELVRLEKLYKAIDIPCEFNTLSEGAIQFPIDRKRFETYTKSSEQNQKLRDFRAFIEALNKLSKHCHVYPYQIQIGTSSFVRYDLRTATYIPNINDR